MLLRRVIAVGFAAGVGALLVACAETKPTVKQQFDIREESTAIVNLSVVSPDNLFVNNTPSLIDDRNLVYSAKQWVDGAQSNVVSVWRSPSAGGAATKLVPAGENEWLFLARSAPKLTNVYYGLGCAIYSTQKTGAGGRRKYPGTGYCDYGPVPFLDESRILFQSCVTGRDCFYQDTNYIWIMNPDGTNMTQLRQGRDAQLSPDAKKIAFSYKGDIWTMNVDGTEATNLTASDEYADTLPTYTPDGRRIFFTRVNVKASVRQSDIWMMNSDGSEVIQLTMNPSDDLAPYAGVDGYVYFISNRGALVNNDYPHRIWRAQVILQKPVPAAPQPHAGPPAGEPTAR
jgi:hypothetical protein